MKILVGENTIELAPVQFKRGTQEMYDRMLAAGKIDPYTFYLIVDDDSLNLGDKKILTQKNEVKEKKEDYLVVFGENDEENRNYL
jgi:hypothetical protein